MTSSTTISRTQPSTVQAFTVVSSVLTVQTPGIGFVDLTREVARFVADAGFREGSLNLFIRHTSASLTIQENADPSVLSDLMAVLDRLAPQDFGWTHD
ncbi:MAG: YjbQ family protein, partial [Tardiphaga sp.]|nr:YjbQ family protein [Tardiphaga sp.]